MDGVLHQIKAPAGGGKRWLQIEKNATYQDVLEKLKEEYSCRAAINDIRRDRRPVCLLQRVTEVFYCSLNPCKRFYIISSL